MQPTLRGSSRVGDGEPPLVDGGRDVRTRGRRPSYGAEAAAERVRTSGSDLPRAASFITYLDQVRIDDLTTLKRRR